ncbi:2-hydroxyacid dehydrogenase [Cupriavidus sp. SK-3]|uniref:2-hydroxyacid dehydrogenase n=1 Tax=Cupriavidus sp. SK-3 TaxID=1470558 RepID=UPI000AE916DB|nr:glyoxylate/hydroxypyruvate reductase A [Cupriavidus sp. SK-3]
MTRTGLEDSAATSDMKDMTAGKPPCVALLSSVLDMRYLVPAFRAAAPGLDLRMGPDLGALDEIDAAVCWVPPPGLLAAMPKLRLVQSLGAGIDHLRSDPDLPSGPTVCRIVDTAMAGSMTAYVTWAVIQHQRSMGAYLASAAARQWQEQPIVAPSRHRVGIAGLGTLGVASARALQAVGYSVRGWSRSPKTDLPEGVEAFHGQDGLDAFLAGCDALVCLLPLTAQTQGFLCAGLFARLPRGAHLINVGRGSHLVEADLLRALDEGTLGAATLDAFQHEPLPAEHPFWRHPRIVVTPHVAARTDSATIARQTLDNLAQLRRGQRPAVAVDPARGY